MPEIGKRVTLLRAGKPKRKVILFEPPFPEIGETVVDENQNSWLVVGVEDTEILIHIRPENLK